MNRFKVGFLGCGARSVSYARAFVVRDDIDIVAVADPKKENRKTMLRKAGVAGTPEEFPDWRDLLLACDDLDGVVVSTPNHLHADPAVACLERGIPTAVEKPLATTKSDCERIVDAERANGGRTVVGFVLRSTPFYRTIHDAIASDRIGRLVSVQADELVGTLVSSVMNRGPWRRYTRTSGGAMLEKSCHDLDILNWMTGSRPVSLDSHGRRSIFTPNPALPERCDECRVADECLYYKRPVRSASEDAGEEVLLEFAREDDRCIYNIDKDIVDTQSVIVEYENGVLATFMLTFNCPGPRASRNFHAVGTAGRVWGNLHDNEVFIYSNRDDSLRRIDTAGDGSGHGGGDILHALELHKMMCDPTYRPEQDAAAGYLSAAMSFATDVSRTEGRRLYFRYGSNRVDFG